MVNHRERARNITYTGVALTGVVVGDLLAAPEEGLYSWTRAGVNAAASLADLADGWEVRKDPDGPTEEGADLDQQADKVKEYATQIAIAIKLGDSLAAASFGLDVVRDGIVGRKRQEIRDLNRAFEDDPEFTPVDVKARPLGKAKTWAKSITNTVELSPLGKKYPNAVRLMRVGSMALTVASGIDFVVSANKAMDKALDIA